VHDRFARCQGAADGRHRIFWIVSVFFVRPFRLRGLGETAPAIEPVKAQDPLGHVRARPMVGLDPTTTMIEPPVLVARPSSSAHEEEPYTALLDDGHPAFQPPPEPIKTHLQVIDGDIPIKGRLRTEIDVTRMGCRSLSMRPRPHQQRDGAASSCTQRPVVGQTTEDVGIQPTADDRGGDIGETIVEPLVVKTRLLPVVGEHAVLPLLEEILFELRRSTQGGSPPRPRKTPEPVVEVLRTQGLRTLEIP